MTETMSSEHNRAGSVDIFRALGIILMIMGHIKFGGYFDKWIHAFHMPMFFFVSGWFFRSRDNIGGQILKKARSLLLPYICFEVIQWAILMIFVPEYRSFQVLRYVFFENTYKIPVEEGTFGISPIPGAMWFLTAIFFAEVIYILLDRVLGCNWKLHLTVIALGILGMVLPKILPFRLPWALDAALAGMVFFHVARIIRETRLQQIMDLKWWLALILGAGFSVSILLCPKINMRTGEYGWYISFWVNALGLIIAGWSLSKYVDKILKHGKLLTGVSNWLKGIGRNSIVYLCLNQSVILLTTKMLDLIGVRGFISKIPVLILTMAVLFGLEKLICKTKIRVILGK